MKNLKNVLLLGLLGAMTMSCTRNYYSTNNHYYPDDVYNRGTDGANDVVVNQSQAPASNSQYDQYLNERQRNGTVYAQPQTQTELFTDNNGTTIVNNNYYGLSSGSNGWGTYLNTWDPFYSPGVNVGWNNWNGESGKATNSPPGGDSPTVSITSETSDIARPT